MSIINPFRKKNSLDSIKLPELQEEEQLLKCKINRTHKEVDDIEKQKKKVFNAGVGADFIKKKMLAQEFKQLDMDEKLKFNHFKLLYKQYMFVSNLVVVKKYQKELETTPIWNKIRSISPDVFESALIKANISGKKFEDILDELNRVFGLSVSDAEMEVDEDEKKLFDAWDRVQSGSLDAAEAESMFSLEKEIEKSLDRNEF